MSSRSALVLFVLVLAAILVAKLVFHVRVHIAGFKYLAVVIALVAIAGWAATADGGKRSGPP